MQHLGAVAGRHRREGQRRRRQQCQANTKGAIGYVETAYAKQNNLTTTKMINKNGKTVEANAASVPGRCRQRRLGACRRLQPADHRPAWRRRLADLRIDLHHHGEGSQGFLRPPGEALKFFAWAYKNGDKLADELDYVAMPANVKDLVMKSWSVIKGADGKPVVELGPQAENRKRVFL